MEVQSQEAQAVVALQQVPPESCALPAVKEKMKNEPSTLKLIDAPPECNDVKRNFRDCNQFK
jgi:hypothetical protein